MGKLRVPDNVTSITLGGVVSVPDVFHEVDCTDAQAAQIVPQQFQPKLIIADQANGNVTVQLPALITSISFAAVAYEGDGQNRVVLPPLVATQFLGAESWHPFKYGPALTVNPNFNPASLFAGGITSQILQLCGVTKHGQCQL